MNAPIQSHVLESVALSSVGNGEIARQNASEPHQDVTQPILSSKSLGALFDDADASKPFIQQNAGNIEAENFPVQTVHLRPKNALTFLNLKCPTIRHYCSGNAPAFMPLALRSGLNRTLAAFEGGEQLAQEVASAMPSFDQAQFDQRMGEARLASTPCYTCATARADGSINCPAGGCLLPTGEIASSPTELLSWNCNIDNLSQKVIAKSVVSSEFCNALLNVGSKNFGYADGFYSEISEDVLRRKILPHLGSSGTVKQVREIARMIHIANVNDLNTVTPNPNLICFRNGTLNVSTRQFQAHNSQHLLMNRIDHDYLPNTNSDRFMQFLRDIWRDDADRDQKIQFIRQWLGYLLVADPSLQKMLILKGEGANGKSVLMDIVRHMIGEKNTVSAMLDRLRMPHVRATLDGKLLNQSADLPKRGIVSDGDLKALISGDPIEVSPKFKPSYTIRPYVRLMVATNNMPHTNDTSEGYFRRLVILSFNRQFAEQERNPHLLQSLIAETQGIIAWAVGGLYELREAGRFSIPASSMQAVAIYREELSPTRLFTQECLEPSSDRTGFTPVILFTAYRNWCRDRGFSAGNLISFGRELSALGLEHRKSGRTLWLVKVKGAGLEYFKLPKTAAPTISACPRESPGGGHYARINALDILTANTRQYPRSISSITGSNTSI